MLTGATGFLGNHILALLIEAHSVEKIHCIAIRNSDKLSEFAYSPKVVLHGGDLSLLRYGLPFADAISIFGFADAIIHNGADVSFLKTYSSLKASNFTSIKQLVKLALPNNTLMHFISTGIIGKLINIDSLAPKTLANSPPGLRFANGYAASK